MKKYFFIILSFSFILFKEAFAVTVTIKNEGCGPNLSVHIWSEAESAQACPINGQESIDHLAVPDIATFTIKNEPNCVYYVEKDGCMFQSALKQLATNPYVTCSFNQRVSCSCDCSLGA